MFRHQGKTRTLSHNLKIASLLSFVAGVVNVAGFFAVQQLTTNVTGHFAFFTEEIFRMNFWKGLVYFLYILFFFLGSFISNFLIELTSRNNDRYIYAVPVALECIILFSTGFWGNAFLRNNPDIIAFSLLFAMGLQNSLVTTISSSRVRTTHLTGLFTDLGIELSQLFFYRGKQQKQQLVSSMKLRMTIILFFFSGGIAGGILFSKIRFYAFVLAGILLIAGLIYDHIKYKLILLKRRLKNNG
jgi:uncharacterized membrane protein YoaK (UPF0700 family)